MRNLLSGIKARVERLTVQSRAVTAAFNLEKCLQRLNYGRTNPGPHKLRTPEESAAWSARLRACARGPFEANLMERLIGPAAGGCSSTRQGKLRKAAVCRRYEVNGPVESDRVDHLTAPHRRN